MSRRWVGKNLDLAMLSERIEDFFRQANFKTRRGKSTNGCTISVAPRLAHDVREDITVKIVGSSNDFLIEFCASERTRSSILLGVVTTAIGGGNLILRGVRSREALEKLKQKFWVLVENTILELVGSEEQSGNSMD